MKIEKNKIVLYLLLFFLILRIGVVITAGEAEKLSGDAIGYNEYAAAILQKGDWLTNPDFIGNSRPPVYPLFIALIYVFFGINNYIAVYIFQAVISAATCFYIYKLCKRIFNEKAALLSLIWAGFYIPYLRYVRTLLRETSEFFLVIVIFYYVYLYLNEKVNKNKYFWVFSLSYFLLIHMSPKYLFFLPFMVIVFILYNPFFQGVKKYIMFFGVTVLLMVPWTLRNYIAYDGFVLIGSKNLDFRNNHKKSMNENFMKESFKVGQASESIHDNIITEDERKLIKQGLNPKNRSKDEIIAVKNDIYPPSGYWERRLYMLIQFWRPTKFKGDFFPYPSGKFNKWSFRHNVSNILCYGSLLPFMIIGIFVLIRSRNKDVVFLIFPPLMQALFHMLVWSRERYRHPIDAFIIILGVYGLYLGLKLLKKSFLKRKAI